MLFGEPNQPLARPVHELGVGRKRHRLRLHGRVDDHLREVRGLGRADACRRVQALLDQRDELLLAHALAPARQRRSVERQLVTEELLATEELEVRVLDPARAEVLVRQIARVLEDRQAPPSALSAAAVDPACPNRQRRTAPPGTASRLSTASFASGWPMSTIWSRRALKKSLCPLSRRSFGRIANRSHRLSDDRESRLEVQLNSQVSSPIDWRTRQKRILPNPRKRPKTKRLQVLHGRLRTLPGQQTIYHRARDLPSSVTLRDTPADNLRLVGLWQFLAPARAAPRSRKSAQTELS